MDSNHVKQEFRQQALKQRQDLSKNERLDRSRRWAERMFGSGLLESVSALLLYAANGGELDPEPLRRKLSDTVQVGFPRVEEGESLAVYQVVDPDTELEPGYREIPEPDPDQTQPLEPKQLDVVLVPGLMFDPDGYRVGYGGGFYDRFLDRLPDDTTTVGVGYGFQIRDRVPRMDHDEPVDVVVTPERVLRPS